MDRFRISTGTSILRPQEWRNVECDWDTFVKRIGNVTRTSETMEEWKRMTKAQRAPVKDVGGFIGGPMEVEGDRHRDNIRWRTLVTIDIDGDMKHTPGVEKIRGVLEAMGWTYVMHSTHTSTPEWPRLRVILPLDRPADPETYEAVTRRLAGEIGFDVVDGTTVQCARVMFWPSIPKDAPYIFETGGSGPVDCDAVLATYVDWHNVAEWPGTDESMRRAARARHVNPGGNGLASDPTAKEGIIGAFCSIYDVPAAIEAFGLPYRNNGRFRYTYTDGSTYGGAVVYGQGAWLYSNHATDPASGQLCNAFDLVRLHRFGGMDAGASYDTPVAKLPSYAAMCRLAMDDRTVKVELVKRNMGDIPDTDGGKTRSGAKSVPQGGDEDPLGALLGTDRETPSEGGNEGGADGWQAGLDTNTKGDLKSSIRNYRLILTNDPALKGKLMYNTFDNSKYIVEKTHWLDDETSWPHRYSDFDREQIRTHISEMYKLDSGKDNLDSALAVEFDNNRHHPVREWLGGLRWDGVKRAETFFIDYLGAADNELNRVITVMHLRAAVRRIFRPGCKYDQVLVFVGREKIGKSTIIHRLAHSDDWFSDSSMPVGDKEAYVNIAGKWLIEMGELSDYSQKDGTLYKQFLSAQNDSYRPPYGRESVTMPRQCVFFGTTNDDAFLKGGRQGNRRFWIMECCGDERGKEIGTAPFDEVVSQVWAEVLQLEKGHEAQPLILDDRLEALMNTVRNGHEGELLDNDLAIIEEYVLMPKPKNWRDMPVEEKRQWYRNGHSVFDGFDAAFGKDGVIPYLQEYVSVKEIALVVFGQRLDEKSRFQDQRLKYKCDHVKCLEWTGQAIRCGVGIGVQKVYKVARNGVTGTSYNE